MEEKNKMKAKLSVKRKLLIDDNRKLTPEGFFMGAIFRPGGVKGTKGPGKRRPPKTRDSAS